MQAFFYAKITFLKKLKRLIKFIFIFHKFVMSERSKMPVKITCCNFAFST